MDATDLARRLVEALRARGQISDAQLALAGQYFAAGQPPERCLVMAGVPSNIVNQLLAELGMAQTVVVTPAPGQQAPTVVLGSVPGMEPLPARRDVIATPASGEWLGAWRILRPLGEGGMAAVSLAEDAQGRRAAIKVIHPHLLGIPEARTRFLREVHATRKIRHRNVVAVLDVAPDEAPRAWLAVEFVDGGSVGDLLKKHGRLPLAVALEIFAQMLAGLEAAHELHVVHRDLKPDNLLLSSEGVVKIADFGVARELDATQMTQTGSTLGTPAYMSPEQARAEPIDGRSDLYTAGVILYELLTGARPFQGDSIGAVVASILVGRAAPLFEVDPTIPEGIDELVAALMRGKREQRPSSAAAVRLALAPLVEETRRAHPNVLKELLQRPETAQQLRREQAAALLTTARQLLQMGAAQREAAGLCLMRARLLDGDNAEVAQLLHGLAAQGVSFATGQASAKIVEVEHQLSSSPDDPVLLQRAAQLWRQEGNVYKAAVYYRRYLRVRPDDTYVQGQLSRITGAPSAPATPALNTVERIAGHIGTSLDVAAAPAIERSAPSTRPAPAPVEEVVPSMSEGLAASWSLYGKKAIAAVVIVGALVFGYRALKERASRHSPLDGSAQGAVVRPGEVNEEQAGKDLDALRAAFDQGRWDDAVKLATAVLDHTEKPSRAATSLVLRGRARLAMNKALSAVEDFSRVVDAYRSADAYEEALVRRGEAYKAAGENDKAIDDFTKALRGNLVQSLQVVARVGRGELLLQKGDVAGARTDLRWAVDYSPPSDPLHAQAKDRLASMPPG